MDQITHLFVYGTLAPGKRNHHIMQGIDGNWQAASMRGSLFTEGWGAAHDCPGVVPSANGGTIKGLLFTSDKLPQFWQMLDEFEGQDYRRAVVPVSLYSGERLDACVYTIRDTISHRT